jgi:hypothetical protein
MALTKGRELKGALLNDKGREPNYVEEHLQVLHLIVKALSLTI